LREIAGSIVPTRCIPNGYDEDDFRNLETSQPRTGVYRIVHAGTFYGHRSPGPFLAGVRHLLDGRPELGTRLRVRLVGSIGSRFDSELDAFSKDYPGVLERTGYVDHSRALSELVAADALLLVVAGGDAAAGVMTGKVFEYLRAGKPILMVGPASGEAADLILRSDTGTVVDPEQPQQIAALLGHWMMQGTKPEPKPEQVAAFERRRLTSDLAGFLFDVHTRFQSKR
jgi:glycosyltransferase involved in cell wall biosynthesis